jgi:capsular exopolysaccharide synthesis family protein
MSKIYEALQQAHQQKKASGKNLEVIIPQNLLNRNQVEMGEEMLSLFKVIDNRLPELRHRVLLFIGSRPGEGTSTVVREFARIAAERVGQKVLLVDADRFEGTQSKFYSVESQTSWSQAIEEPAEVERAIHRVGESSLFVSPASNSGSPTPELFNALRFEDFWANVKLNFDLVVIDSSPLALSPDALAIASKVDGVIMVVEAEKTRWRTAKYVKEQIEGVGGSLLGVVFNKRHFYIPQSIYKHL